MEFLFLIQLDTDSIIQLKKASSKYASLYLYSQYNTAMYFISNAFIGLFEQ
jgi:hypothetical protein